MKIGKFKRRGRQRTGSAFGQRRYFRDTAAVCHILAVAHSGQTKDRRRGKAQNYNNSQGKFEEE